MTRWLKIMDAAKSRSVAGPTPFSGAHMPIYARIDVVNRRQIEAAFGENALAALMTELQDRVAALMSAAGLVCSNDECLEVFIDKPEHLVWPVLGNDGVCARAVENGFVRHLQTAVVFDKKSLLPLICVAAAPIEPVAGAPDDLVFTFSRARAALLTGLSEHGIGLAAIQKGSRGAQRYVADMAIAALVARAIDESRLYLAWQPIISAAPGGPWLYHEGLCRIADPTNEFAASDYIILPSDFIPALERTGLVRELDAHVTCLTITRLRGDPGLELGCNISAQSAVIDGWWFDIMNALDAEPELASRLTIEITETTSFASLASAIDFVRCLRRLHCRIAIGGFGAGRVAIRDVAALKPDIIKIGGHFLQRLEGHEALLTLQSLAALAATLAAEVVIEGVDDTVSARFALKVGGCWLQGSHIGDPCMTLPKKPFDIASDDDPVLHLMEYRPRMRRRGLVTGLLMSSVLWGLIVLAWRSFL